MKIVQTMSGIKRIESRDKEVTMLQVREILNEQRKLLINRLLQDLHTYIDYRFHVRADQQQLDHIKERLDAMKNYAVDLNNYEKVLQQVLVNDRTHLTTAPFYQEIDACISHFLNDVPLKLGR
jgi:hypothetical protein